MNELYDLHSWSRLYRQDALEEARVRRLAAQAGAERRPRSRRSRFGLVRATSVPEARRKRAPIR